MARFENGRPACCGLREDQTICWLLEVTSIGFAEAKGERSLGRVFAAGENDLTDIAFIRDKFPQVKTRNPDDY